MSDIHRRGPFNATIRVHPALGVVDEADLVGNVAVVIDLLRATTTITAAIAAGATEVIPCSTIAEASARASSFPRDLALLCGERDGVQVRGFDLGNSPQEYTPERVRGKSLVMTTTNGTRAVLRASRAAHVLAGCLWNLTALSDMAWKLAWDRKTRAWRSIHIVCAGVHDKPCVDDTLAAGAVVARLIRALPSARVDDHARTALKLWESLPDHGLGLVNALRESEGGQNLVAIGFADQITHCAAVDTTPVVPVLRPSLRIVDGTKRGMGS